jgi:plastocyanin
VPRGQSLSFINQDDPNVEWHSITTCRAPCNRQTGISYPLANGLAGTQFDSGQLGFGPAGASPAANRVTWQTPSNLPQGTYTYFCRIHPFMRGAFKVQ